MGDAGSFAARISEVHGESELSLVFLTHFFPGAICGEVLALAFGYSTESSQLLPSTASASVSSLYPLLAFSF